MKVLREGGETGMVLHVTNQGQRLQKCVKEGMRGRTVGLSNNLPPFYLWGCSGRGTTGDILCVQ